MVSSHENQVQINSKMAHAWLEYYNGDSWQRVDPTNVVSGQSPESIPASQQTYQHNTAKKIEKPTLELVPSSSLAFQQLLEKWLELGLDYYNSQLQQALLKKWA